MPRYIAFLRAINVGGHVVKMDALRTLFEGLGFGAVETFIASGNVIFDCDDGDTLALEAQIAARLRAALGYEVATFIMTVDELAQIARCQPFAARDGDDEAMVYVGFMARTLDEAAQRAVMSFRTEVDDFHVDQRQVYLLCRIRSSDSDFSLARFEKATGVQATFRNMTTVRKMVERYGGECEGT